MPASPCLGGPASCRMQPGERPGAAPARPLCKARLRKEKGLLGARVGPRIWPRLVCVCSRLCSLLPGGLLPSAHRVSPECPKETGTPPSTPDKRGRRGASPGTPRHTQSSRDLTVWLRGVGGTREPRSPEGPSAAKAYSRTHVRVALQNNVEMKQTGSAAPTWVGHGLMLRMEAGAVTPP